MQRSDLVERLLWSIALPGFGQLLNRRFLKGLLLIVLEFLINVRAKLNLVIVFSFQGDMAKAVEATDYQWLMFYPCLYLFAIWDAYKDAGGGEGVKFATVPFVFSAYIGTIGVIYSSTFRIGGELLGPVFLPIVALIAGALVGAAVRRVLAALT